jgi:GT2 family glycosyltransferase
MTLSIVTPWRNCLELIPDYERAVAGSGAEVVIVDNGSETSGHANEFGVEYNQDLLALALRLGGTYHRNPENVWFARGCNQGLALATGDVVLMLNNDIRAEPGGLAVVERETPPQALVGPSMDVRIVAGLTLAYVEGWCLAARRETWQALGGFDAETFQRPYWEDVDLSWRAARQGCRLLRRPWPVTHLSNYTSRRTAGAYDASEANRAAFESKVKASMSVDMGVGR